MTLPEELLHLEVPQRGRIGDVAFGQLDAERFQEGCVARRTYQRPNRPAPAYQLLGDVAAQKAGSAGY